MLKNLRIVLATLSMVAMLLLFADFTGMVHRYLGWMATIQAVPALMAANLLVILALIVATLLFGRVYCSVVCPLGIFQDMVWSRHKPRQKYSPAMNWLRYIMLGAFVAAVVGGIGAVTALLDPYGTFGIMASNLFAPVYRWGNNLLAMLAEHYESYAFYSVEVWLHSLPALVLAVVFVVVLSVLSWRGGRTYCNTICPVGTVLGVLSRWSLLRIRIDADKCNGCGRCARGCKASCIDFKSHAVDLTRCVDCMDCIGQCRQGAISYGLAMKGRVKAPNGGSPKSGNTAAPGFDKGRREALAIGASLIATTAFAQAEKTTDGGLAFIEDKKVPRRKTPLVPPGAMSLQHMQEKCVQCQLCVSSCPNGVLRPSTDATMFMVPVMSYENGFCRPECTRCADVCPADAIKPISREFKSSTQIGCAQWVRENCVVLTDEVSCGVCARHCPSGAIEMLPLEPSNPKSPRTPMIDKNRCIGCGACEHLCPARPFAAIVVEGHEVHKTI